MPKAWADLASPLGWSIKVRLIYAAAAIALLWLSLAWAIGWLLMDAIILHDLTLGYDGHPAVHHLSGVFEAGSMTVVVGPNGSGKSTLSEGTYRPVAPAGRPY